jgi:hypothetical protein
VDAAAEQRRVHPLAHLVRAQVLHGVWSSQGGGRLDRPEAHVLERRSCRDAQIARLVVPGVDVVAGAPGADRGHGLAGGIEQLARGVVAEALAQRRGAQPERLAEAAVAPARPGTADAALQQEDTQARLRIEQVPGGPHPRVAAADDDHIRLARTVESRAGSGPAGLLQPPSRGSVASDMRTLIPDGEDPSSR